MKLRVSRSEAGNPHEIGRASTSNPETKGLGRAGPAPPGGSEPRSEPRPSPASPAPGDGRLNHRHGAAPRVTPSGDSPCPAGPLPAASWKPNFSSLPPRAGSRSARDQPTPAPHPPGCPAPQCPASSSPKPRCKGVCAPFRLFSYFFPPLFFFFFFFFSAGEGEGEGCSVPAVSQPPNDAHRPRRQLEWRLRGRGCIKTPKSSPLEFKHKEQ